MERRGRLLLIEDEAGLRGLVAQFLRLQAYEVIEAEDGAEAIRRLDDPDAASLDLALLDLNLPHVHGVEVARHLRSVLPDLPVIVCSAAVIDDHASELRELGVRRFLGKPYHPEHLLAAIAAERSTSPGADLVMPAARPLR